MILLPSKIILFAILGALLTGIACSLMGSFVVRMNLSSLGFCMSHAAFAGAALGLVLSFDPLIMAIISSVFIALILGPIAEKAKLDTNIVLGILFSLTISLGLIFLNFAPGTAMSSSALSLLWGSILGISLTDILRLVIITSVIILIVILFFKEFQSIMFSRKMAEASGINTKPVYYLILILTGITVALSLKLVGGLLVFALMVNPASSAYQFFYDMKTITIFSPIIGVLCCLLGIVLSFYLDMPTGASIAIVSSLIFGISVIISPKRRRG
ncbi:MAG: iron chelate uptake ABC transporter family permease subunit [Euryarchaeota archaeon]|nr:iron chelate uptake ABC transporter family permease subunit [Euryarchaeota archaeon]